MNVKITVDKSAAERRGLVLEDVRQTVKSLFAVHDLPCVSGGEVLIFRDKGHGDDFAAMWDVILSLLRSDWFRERAASCVWADEGGGEADCQEFNFARYSCHVSSKMRPPRRPRALPAPFQLALGQLRCRRGHKYSANVHFARLQGSPPDPYAACGRKSI